MRLSRRTNAIIMWLLAAGLLVGMIVTFTPALGNLGSLLSGESSPPALLVNGEPISELEVARARQNPLFSIVTEGEAAQDLELLLLDSLIEQELIDQAAARIRVGSGEVRKAVNEFRASRGVDGSRNDQAYLRLIGGAGFTDATFRDFLRQQLRRQKWEQSVIEDVTVSDEEIAAFYELNKEAYRSEDRIRARMIVVDDAELAQELHDRAAAGEDFAALAGEYSLERADRGGALGAPQGSTEPQPVGRAALPTAVAQAAFSLQGPGLTDVVNVSDQYYIVAVEEYLPSEIRPLEEVRDRVEADALAAKQQGVLERTIRELRAQAEITVPERSLVVYNDPVVARVGETEIHASELVRATYGNQQIQQALSPETAPLITGFFKPNILEQLIEQELAYQGAEKLDIPRFGTKAQVAQAALAKVTADVEVSEDEIVSYYQTNIEQFTTPASAAVTQVVFDSEEAALNFRAALLAGSPIDGAAEAFAGRSRDLGVVGPGQLPTELDAVVFETDAFDPLPEGVLSEVTLENAEVGVSDVLVLPASVVGEGQDAAAGEDAAAADATAEGATAEDAAAEDATAEDEAPADTAAEAAAPADTAAEDGTATDVAPDTAEDAAPDAAADAAADAAVPLDEGQASTEESAEPQVYVVLVVNRTAEVVQPLEEVRSVVEEAVRNEKRQELRTAWLDSLREEITVENLLALAQADSESFTSTPTHDPMATDTPDPSADAAADAAAADAGDPAAPAADLAEAQARSAELTNELRSLVGRTDLDEAGQQRLEQLQASLEQLQQQVAEFEGARGTYTVAEGDTLSSIAEQVYGSSARWEEILAANDYLIDDADLIFPGFVLLLPEVDTQENN